MGVATKTVADKLLVKAGTALWPSDRDRAGIIGDLPDGARLVASPGDASIALVFADAAAPLRETLNEHAASLRELATVWVAYPKGKRTDINRDSLWPILGEYGLRPNGQVAIDEIWSALRFRPLKEGEAPFTGGGK
jgi:hypothetical protein